MRKLELTAERAMPLRELLRSAGITAERERALLAAKDIRINGVRVKQNAPLEKGDGVLVFLPDDMPEVLYENMGVLAVLKPRGVAVTGDGDTLESRVRTRYSEARACHRLDVNTAGVLLMALDNMTEKALLEDIKERRIGKFYYCVTLGAPEKKRALLRAYLVKDEKRSSVRVSSRERSGALPIATAYSVIAEIGGLALLEVELLTGRTHQIRAHMAFEGHPILGDDKYGDREQNRAYGCFKQLLFAYKLTLADGTVIIKTPDFYSAFMEGRLFDK